jgi:hypothetical protein
VAWRVASLGVALALVFAVPAGARQSAGNLLQDGGAEEAQGSGDQVVPIPGWTTTETFTAGLYGANGLPAASRGPPGAGKNLFAGGPGSSVSTATQTLDVSSNAAAIDAGTLNATLDGWLGGWETQEDSASATAQFLDGARKTLAAITIGPVTAADRGGQTKLLERTAKGNVPRGTRFIQVTITARRASGVYNDGYADNLSLTLAAGPAQPTAAIRATFWFSAVGPAARSAPADYIGSQVRGSGTLKLVHSVRQGGTAEVTSGSGTIRLLHHFALHTERLWLAVHGGGRAGRDDLLAIVVGVTGSNAPNCPKGRAGFMTLYDNTGTRDPDEVYLHICGRTYDFGRRSSTTARVYIVAAQ